jgi:hypothetical protein
MTTTEITIILLGAGFIYTANAMWKNYLNNQAKNHDTDAKVLMSKQETERLAIVQNATNNNQTLNDINNQMNKIRSDMFKNMQDED